MNTRLSCIGSPALTWYGHQPILRGLTVSTLGAHPMTDQTRYSVLCADFAARQADRRKWSTDAREFAVAFCKAFNSYLGSPDDFEHVSGHSEQAVRLSDLVEVDGKVALASHQKAPKNTDCVVVNSEGECVFAVQVHLSEGYSTNWFTCLCRFTLRDNIADLYIGDQKTAFKLPIDDPASLEPALKALYTHYRTYIQQRPSSERKAQMGFLQSRDEG